MVHKTNNTLNLKRFSFLQQVIFTNEGSKISTRELSVEQISSNKWSQVYIKRNEMFRSRDF